MLLKTAVPSAGQPVPEYGLQLGDEYGRKPTSVTGVPVPGAPVMVQAAGAEGLPYGQGMFDPPVVAPGMYGMWKVCPAGTVNE